MKGKIVNLLMGILNIMVGIVILIFTIRVPNDLMLLTVQEKDIITILKFVIYAVLGICYFLNFFGFYQNKTNEGLKFGYKLFLFTISFILIHQPFIALIPIFSGIIIIKNILKENLREVESIFYISIIIVLMVLTIIIDGFVYFYSYLGTYILDKKNENQIEYSDSFFRYITELEDTDLYINVKKNGKYGYINQKGETKIDFEYDYASPFTTIKAYEKEFEIALVCKDGISQIILKNGRVVKSYVSESSDENYEAKIKELEDFYKNELKMTNKMKFEIAVSNNSIKKVEAYNETSEEYTYKYDYNDEYDLIVIQSSMGLKDTYALVKKDNPTYQIELDCENLDYDKNYLYLYSDGTIPFYNTEKGEQGWFSTRGVKKSIKGNIQILEKIGDVFLYKEYSKNGQITFVNQNGEKLSDSYKDIYVQGGRYIVKKSNDKYTVIDSNYNQIFEGEYDYVDVSLLNYGIYLFGNINDDVIEFNDYDYADLNFTMLDYEGNVINENLEQVYQSYYKFNYKEEKVYVSRYNKFMNDLKKLNHKFVGDKFYKK